MLYFVFDFIQNKFIVDLYSTSFHNHDWVTYTLAGSKVPKEV